MPKIGVDQGNTENIMDIVDDDESSKEIHTISAREIVLYIY